MQLRLIVRWSAQRPATSLNNLAELYQYMGGNYAKAEPLLQRALAIQASESSFRLRDLFHNRQDIP
jgi:hypothetical protein